MAFVKQNNNKLLDMIEDTIRTAMALVRAAFPSFQIELDDARRDFPHHKPLDILLCLQNAVSLIKLDAVRNIVLDVSYHSSSHQRTDLRAPIVWDLGGVQLEQATQVQAIQNGRHDDFYDDDDFGRENQRSGCLRGG